LLLIAANLDLGQINLTGEVTLGKLLFFAEDFDAVADGHNHTF